MEVHMSLPNKVCYEHAHTHTHTHTHKVCYEHTRTHACTHTHARTHTQNYNKKQLTNESASLTGVHSDLTDATSADKF